MKEQNYFYLMGFRKDSFWTMLFKKYLLLDYAVGWSYSLGNIFGPFLFYRLYCWFRSPYRWKVYLILAVIGHFIIVPSSWQSVYQAAWIQSVWRIQIFSKWAVQHCRTMCSNNFTINLQPLFLVLQPCLPVVMTMKLLRRAPSQS